MTARVGIDEIIERARRSNLLGLRFVRFIFGMWQFAATGLSLMERLRRGIHKLIVSIGARYRWFPKVKRIARLMFDTLQGSKFGRALQRLVRFWRMSTLREPAFIDALARRNVSVADLEGWRGSVFLLASGVNQSGFDRLLRILRSAGHEKVGLVVSGRSNARTSSDVPLEVISLQDLWTEGDVDIGVHRRSQAFMDRLLCDPDVPPIADFNPFALFYIDCYSAVSQLARVENAVKRLIAAENRAIIIESGDFLGDRILQHAAPMLVQLAAPDALVCWDEPSFYRIVSDLNPEGDLDLPVSIKRRMWRMRLLNLFTVFLPLVPDISRQQQLQFRHLIKQRPVTVVICDAQPRTPFSTLTTLLVRHLRKRGRTVIFISASAKACVEFAPQVSYADFIKISLKPTAGQASEQDFRNAAAIITRQPLPMADEGLRAAFLSWLTDPTVTVLLRIARDQMLQMRELLRIARPDAVHVFPHWGTAAHVAQLAANFENVRTVSMPVVTVAGNPASIIGWGNLSVIGTYGRQCRDAFVAMGYDPSRLRPVGNVFLDEARRLDRAAIRRELAAMSTQVRSNVKMLLLATSYIDPNERLWVSTLAAICARRGDTVLVIRPHPSFGREAYEWSKTLPAVAVVEALEIHEMIVAADAVITDFSTVGSDAVLLGRRLIVVNLTGRKFPSNDYVEAGVARGVTQECDLERAVMDSLDAEVEPPAFVASRRKFVEDYAWPNDGHALDRLVDLASGPAA
ncbi:MAG: hypothetical protein KGJ66_10880 [Alphaproteobacteria bacterium]|nr:hypothetical protein [Alphaproteobacteria bacterium]